MTSRFTGITRAVSILAMGMAFLLSGCQTTEVLEKRVPVREETRVLFSLAEEAFQAQRFEEALRDYELYLERHPDGENAGTSVYRIARIHHQSGRYDKALAFYLRLIRDYSTYPLMPKVRLAVADLYFRLGDYSQAKAVALEWLLKHPQDPQKKDVLLLLGDCAKALGDAPGTVHWWFKASREPGLSEEKREVLSEKIAGLIRESSLEDLRKMSQEDILAPFFPFIYHRLASLYLETHDLEMARESAMALVRSTQEQTWVSLGRLILERIEGELSVKQGVIGCLLPLSGPFAIYGQEVLNGIQLGMDLFTESEESQGIELVIKDTAGNPQEAALQILELAERGKVMAVIGPLATKTALAAAKRAQELKVPIITLTQAEGITSQGDMIFRNFLTPAKEVKGIVDKAVNEFLLNRFAILYPDNPYGRVLMNLFWNRVEELGGMITAVESFDPKETDFADQIKKMVGLYYPRPESVKMMLKEKRILAGEDLTQEKEEKGEEAEEPEPIVDFDAVFIPDNYQQVALIAPQFPFHDVFRVRLLGTNLWQSPELISQAGDYIQGAIFPSGFFSEEDSEIVREFVERYRSNFEGEPSILAATGFDTIRFVKLLLKGDPIRTREEFRSRILSSTGLYGVTGKIAFDLQGEVVKDPILLTVSGRRLTIAP